jgi:DNA-binding HxlR family transcriptional regulator
MKAPFLEVDQKKLSTSKILVTVWNIAADTIYSMADTTKHAPAACDEALTRAFGFLGKRWNGQLLATLLSGPSGFSDLKRAVVGISDSVLSERLTELSKAGLVQRTVSEGPPVAVEYKLTVSGEGLAPAIQALGDWAAKNLQANACPSMESETPAS